MEEPQRKKSQRHEGTKPRKVRFKLASSYSGRVLKHVYEDGQELDSPEEKYPHSFLPHGKIAPSHLEMEQLCGFEEPPSELQRVEPPTGLIAQRINVYRGIGSCKAAAGQTNQTDGDTKSSVLDFGKLIIYTSNLRIVRAPAKKADALRHGSAPPAFPEGYLQARERGSRRRAKALGMQEGERKPTTHTQEPGGCQDCGNSGCTPCSLCHGSKLSMLANRFNESISELRCQACYPHGFERCQACSGDSKAGENRNRGPVCSLAKLPVYKKKTTTNSHTPFHTSHLTWYENVAGSSPKRSPEQGSSQENSSSAESVMVTWKTYHSWLDAKR